jgi:hypothetical protein
MHMQVVTAFEVIWRHVTDRSDTAVKQKEKETPWLLVRRRTISTGWPRILVPTFADRGLSRSQRSGSARPLISVF